MVSWVRVGRYLLLAVLVAAAAVLLGTAGTIVAAGQGLEWPASVLAGGWGGAGLGVVLTVGVYLLGRRDGIVVGFSRGVGHRDRQAADRAWHATAEAHDRQALLPAARPRSGR